MGSPQIGFPGKSKIFLGVKNKVFVGENYMGPISPSEFSRFPS